MRARRGKAGALVILPVDVDDHTAPVLCPFPGCKNLALQRAVIAGHPAGFPLHVPRDGLAEAVGRADERHAGVAQVRRNGLRVSEVPVTNVVPLPSRKGHDPLCTYDQLTKPGVLTPEGVSKRTLQQWHNEERMPCAGLDFTGRKTFRLSEVRGFLEERNRRLGRTGGDAA